MKTKLFSIIVAGSIILVGNTNLLANNNSAKDLATESIEIATQAVKEANASTQNIKEYVDSRLNDTILMNGKPVTHSHESNELLDYYNERNQREHDVITKSFNFVERLGKGLIFFVALIIIITVIAEYLKRRQKYKVIEKAIENNYPLPPGFLGKDVRPTTIQHIHYTQGATNDVNVKRVSEYKMNDWANFRSGIKWCAWGISFMLFFIIIEAPIWVFALIPLIIGIGKLYASFKIQQSIDNAKQYSQKVEDGAPTPPPFSGENIQNN